MIVSSGSSTGYQWPSISSLRSWYILTYCALHGLSPNYITDLLKPYVPAPTLCVLRERTCWLRLRQDWDHNYGDRRFAHAAPTLWNGLSLNIRNADSLYNTTTTNNNNNNYIYWAGSVIQVQWVWTFTLQVTIFPEALSLQWHSTINNNYYFFFL